MAANDHEIAQASGRDSHLDLGVQLATGLQFAGLFLISKSRFLRRPDEPFENF